LSVRFFLYDGCSAPANGGSLNAIQAHVSSGSEANSVILMFNQLTNQQEQDLQIFLHMPQGSCVRRYCG